MSQMPKKIAMALAWALACLFALPFVWGALSLTVRSLPPSAQQVVAMPSLSESPAGAGENAFAAVFLLPFDIPEAEQGTIWHETERALDVFHQQVLDGGQPDPKQVQADLGDRYPRVDLQPLPPTNCGQGSGSCLAEGAGLDPILLERLRGAKELHKRLDALHRYGHYRPKRQLFFADSWPEGLSRVPAIRADLLLAADAFRSGRTADALARTCRQHTSARRFAQQADLVLTRVIEQYALRASAALVAEMLAELPLAEPIPADCEVLREQPRRSLTAICAAIGGEYAFSRDMVIESLRRDGEQKGFVGRLFYQLMLSDELTERWLADKLGWARNGEILARMEADDPGLESLLQTWDSEVSLPQCLAAPGSCLIMREVDPHAFQSYALRSVDDVAASRSLSALLRLRERMASGDSADAALRALPSSLNPAQRPLRIENGALVHDNRETSRQATYGLALPGSKLRGVPAVKAEK